MSLFERLFGKSGAKNSVPDISFGRYSDAYKTAEQQAAWNRSLELFDKGEALPAYLELLRYMRDDKADNVRWEETDGKLEFIIRQGSRRITGFATAEKVKAESKIARADDLNVGFLRRLMEYNFTLKFSRFALSPENCLCIVFDTATLDGSPLKLFNALRELSIHADKQDDLLLDEFRMLRPAEAPLGDDIPEAEKEIKYNFIRREIERAFAEIDKGKPDPNQFPGGYAYLLLALAFRLDYIVRPEGFMMNALERIHAIYFTKDERNAQLKILALRKEFQMLLDRPKEEYFKEMYRTRSTFGINQPVHHDRITGLIDGELPNMQWHLKENHPVLALAIPQYVAGYALFHFAPPKPARDLLHLFFRITEADIFQELGFPAGLKGADGLPDKRAVLAAIKEIVDDNRSKYPKAKPDTNRLDFSKMELFAKTFLEMIKELDLTRVE